MKNMLSKTKVQELILYGFWGSMTVMFSLASYALLSHIIRDYKIANLISIILTKIFAYIVNKKFVFQTKNSFIGEIKEIFRYMAARSFTGLVDWVGQIILVNLAGMNDILSKAIMIVITTILNYILCSVGVFKK